MAILVIFSMPIISGKLIAYLESDYELNKPSTVATADAIVVLSCLLEVSITILVFHEDGWSCETKNSGRFSCKLLSSFSDIRAVKYTPTQL